MNRTILPRLLISGLVVAWGASARVAAADPGASPSNEYHLPLRTAVTFVTDAETSPGIWAQVGTAYGAEKDNATPQPVEHVFDTTLLFAYGQEKWEVGSVLPIFDSSNHAGRGLHNTHDGIGDLAFWGKFLPVRNEHITAGGGLGITTPTGTHSFGSTNVGFEPFVTAAEPVGPVSIREHLGYQTYTDNHDDSLMYSLAALYPYSSVVGFRAELVGQHGFDHGQVADPIGAFPSTWRRGSDPVSILPGIDLQGVEAGWEILMRITGGGGLTKAAPDYQFGFSLVFAKIMQ
ncbi:MAG TPA: hypothetical protein VGK20_11115 [Candidatus Binatia bacterium]